MKYLFLVMTLFICVSCSSLDRLGGVSYDYRPTLGYEEAGGTWEVFAPPEGKWVWERKEVTYLPAYFSAASVARFSDRPSRNSNFFFAQYPLGEGVHLALWVRPATAFKIERATWGPSAPGIGERREKFIDHSGDCFGRQSQFIDVGMNVVDVDFDNSSVYFLKNGKKIQGVEVDFSPRSQAVRYRDTKPLSHAVYTLGSPQTLVNKQPYFRRDIDHLTFYFRFPMTCADLEGAILVIDGFSRNGKPLPPLKVRLTYYDFSAVPK